MVIDKLYQQAVLDHNRQPRNFYKMADATHQAVGNNALCGDELWIYLHLDANQIGRASFQGEACAIATASASLMSEWLIGKTDSQARQGAANFEHMLMAQPFDQKLLEECILLEPVKAFPSRIKSATLCWSAMCAALDGVAQVTTER